MEIVLDEGTYTTQFHFDNDEMTMTGARSMVKCYISKHMNNKQYILLAQRDT